MDVVFEIEMSTFKGNEHKGPVRRSHVNAYSSKSKSFLSEPQKHYTLHGHDVINQLKTS